MGGFGEGNEDEGNAWEESKGKSNMEGGDGQGPIMPGLMGSVCEFRHCLKGWGSLERYNQRNDMIICTF